MIWRQSSSSSPPSLIMASTHNVALQSQGPTTLHQATSAQRTCEIMVFFHKLVNSRPNSVLLMRENLAVGACYWYLEGRDYFGFE